MRKEQTFFTFPYGKLEICGQSVYCTFLNQTISSLNSKKDRVKKVPDPSTSFNRSKNNAKKIIRCNGWEWLKNNGKPFLPVFVTLTFKEDMKDLKRANREYSRFIQRLNYAVYGEKKAKLQYLGVVEFQDKTRGGVVHYHIIFFNLPFIKNIYEIWDQGIVDVKAVRSMNGLTRYLSKYMVKEAEDGRLGGKKRYFTSKKIRRPIVIKDYFIAKDVFDNLETRLDFQKRFKVDFIGDVDFYSFLLKNNEHVLDFHLDQQSRLAIESEINKQKEKTEL